MHTITETLKLQIYPTSEQTVIFEYSQQQFIKACQYASNYIFKHHVLNKFKLQEEIYHTLRKKFDLPAQIAICVIRATTSRYQTVQTQFKKECVRYRDQHTGQWESYQKDLNHLMKPLQFKQPVLQLVNNRSYAFLKNQTLSLGTLQGRQKVPFSYLDSKYFEKFKDWKWGQGEVLKIKGKWYFHVSVTREVPDFDIKNIQHIVGIDRGLRHIAVTYDELENSIFYNGKSVKQVRAHYQKLRAELQRKGTKSAKKRLRSLNRKENRWMTDVNHRITKALVDHYGPNTLFVIEDLEQVTFNTVHSRVKDQRYEHHSWAFYQFEQFLTYKAEEIGSKVIKIDPRYTSQTCPKCKNVDKSARNYRTHEYCCSQCEYQSNDDRVAAMNIFERGHQWVEQELTHFAQA